MLPRPKDSPTAHRRQSAASNPPIDCSVVSYYLVEHSLPVSGLSPNTIYHFRVSSSDPAGNPSSTGVDITFTTLKTAGGGGDPPVIPKPKPTNPLVSIDSPWPLLALALGAALAAGAGYYVVSRKTKRDRDAAEAESATTVVPETPTIPGTEAPASPHPESPSFAGPKTPASSTTVAHEAAHVVQAHAGPKTPASTTVAHELPHVVQSAAPSRPAPVATKEEVETLEMETGSSGAAAAALDRSRPSHSTPTSTTPLKHIRCPSCKTRIPLYKDGPQIIQCPGCGKKGPYKPKG